MSKYPAPLPHDQHAEGIEFRKAFASAMIKGNQVSPPAQKPAPELGGSASGLVENPSLHNLSRSFFRRRSSSRLVGNAHQLNAAAMTTSGTHSHIKVMISSKFGIGESL